MTKDLTTASQPILWLQAEGYTAYLVGNVVRDLLLGTVSDRLDVDIATSATPDEVANILSRQGFMASLVDAKFGVTAFTYQGVHFEVTTFRADIYDSEFTKVTRYPDKIKFIKSAKADSSRRDLTINAIYYNPASKRFIDYVGGLADIKAGIIKIIGDPKTRFQEDPIRMLRAIRFKHQLGFKYEPATQKAIQEVAPLLAKVSPSVIKKELHKLQALEDYSAAKQDLIRFGFLKLI